MFKSPWFKKWDVISDEGFSISWGRDWLLYNRAGRSMTMTVDAGGRGPIITIFADTANRWDDDPSTEVDESTRRTVLNDVKRALEWKGLSVTLAEPRCSFASS